MASGCGCRSGARSGASLSLGLFPSTLPDCRVGFSVQGYSGSGALSDHYQTVLQAGTGTNSSKKCSNPLFAPLTVTGPLVQGIIFVYDITDEPSFQHIGKWASDVDEVRDPLLCCCLFLCRLNFGLS